MKISHIQLEAFNNCPDKAVVKEYIDKYQLRPHIRVVDVDHAQHRFHFNCGNTLVLKIVHGPSEMRTALALGQMAVRFVANEFTWKVIRGAYIVRLWWD